MRFQTLKTWYLSSCNTALTVAITVTCSPAFAQLERAKSTLNTVQTWLLSIAAVIITIALMFVGARMAFQSAQWKDVAPVFWGGILIGGAPGIAALFVG